MLNTRSFLAVDFGAGSLKVAEFETSDVGGLNLKNFTIKPLGLEGSQDASREATVLKALAEALAEKSFKSKNVNVCAPGYQVFSKFVRLPPVDAAKVTQIIQYEAQQNVPFPLSEVVWDYQIMGSAASGELEVLLVAVKSEIVEGLFRTADNAKLKLQLCDASPAALCNAFKYNYGDLDDCTMLLDIGARTSNLLFFEKGKVFSRSINLGANAITQDFANEAKLKFDEAEKIKIAEGFVSLGGAYEEPDNPHQAAISKIARQFMTKLHIQVNQTMQFYRGQQGGGAPQRLFLSGGASIMPYTAQFFAEKLNVPVEYFNPFRNGQIDPAVNLEELSRVAHSLGEVVGLGLRNLANCPVEMNLMPESTIRWRAFNEKKPYFLITAYSLVFVALAVGFLYQELAAQKEKEITNLEPRMQMLTATYGTFRNAYDKREKARQTAEQISAMMQDRFYWADVLAELRRVMIQSEQNVQKEMAEKRPGIEAGIWIESMTVGLPPAGLNLAPVTPDQSGQPAAAPNPDATINLICRAIDLSRPTGDSAATSETAYAVEKELRNATNYFDPKLTALTGQITPDENTGTFTFGVTVTLANPLKLP
ncbi:MAG TPA: type IV pilus assembly protein PilM [Verrucomicrobiae bacterium]|nr:type IV pilus assembly protein PilM [Verrucomicrobiae bacterium]